jgi:Effector Associated Constant Component 1
VEVSLTVAGDDAAAAMRSLELWLEGQNELRGRVRAVVVAPQPGAMGSVADMLMIALGQGEVATAVASVLVSWIRRQSGKVLVRATRPDGSEITLTADQVRELSPQDVPSLVIQLAATLDGSTAGK